VAWFGDDDSFQGFIDEHALVVVDTDGQVQQLLGAVDEALLDDILGDVTS
jgi:hypothetical protein